MDMKWAHRFLDMAELVASWSKDPSTKVGAVISDDQNRIISVGFNGFPKGVPDDPTLSREEKLARVIHAEENAILFARRDLRGTTISITHPSCGPCASKIAQSGFARVIVKSPTEAWMKRWTESVKIGEDTFAKVGIPLLYVSR